MCWYALRMRRVCAKVCDERLSKMCEASGSETYAAGSGSEGRPRKQKSKAGNDKTARRKTQKKGKRNVLVCAGYAPDMRQGMRQASEQDA